jgi:hemerythrin-like domain-containing protein
MKCTDHLTQDHKIILRALDVLQCMAEGENSERINPNDVEILLRFLRAFADDYHHIKEESVLFPELMRTSEAQSGPLRHLLFEHDQERSLVEGLEDALRCKKSIDFVLFANRLISRIRNHIENEERILFPIIEALISEDQDENVRAGFEKFQPAASLLTDLRFLESKYPRRRSVRWKGDSA